MSNLPLFYQNVVPLNREKHGDWRIEPTNSYAFAAKTNSIYIAAVEFSRAVREYPIVFGKGTEGNVFPVALLGLKNNQNVFVDGKGNWRADYIPAYVRRYPFILAETSQNGESTFTVCLDEDYSGFTQDGKKGQPLFDSNGEQTDLLRHSMDFLKEYQGHIQITTAFSRSSRNSIYWKRCAPISRCREARNRHWADSCVSAAAGSSSLMQKNCQNWCRRITWS
ncbi:MAG: SapC family protein [Gammaproteobacteria bacterium]|nr:SapC family protein [Gammaproteobacteria bacterium]